MAWQVASRNEYDKTISETEAAYLKARAARKRFFFADGTTCVLMRWLRCAQILESSQTLLTVLKRETVTCVCLRVDCSLRRMRTHARPKRCSVR